ncbi:hypothetical protein PCASD_04630 [Puccinia coronata f. sp. avenae]|uniref:Uncharacterized protein n=1 Tax=Puccinia coronata f. sp. avenae TaxID=200324 RepID=A0A2N5UXJ9_9BASI|nr:hypothetical protein PCASD_04630 [Puccinia coronata f. sp. avenae]
MYQTLKVEAQAHGGSSQTTRKQDRSPALEPEDVNKTPNSPSNTPKEESDDDNPLPLRETCKDQRFNAIRAEDSFMAALRYNIQIQTNCFAHRVTLDNGTKSLADISIMRPKVAGSTYATCRKFKELKFDDNPYTKTGLQASWDPTTGVPKAGHKTQSKQPGQNAHAATTSVTNSEKNKVKAP